MLESTIMRPAGSDDADAIARIYNHYIQHGVSTFDETPLPGMEFVQRLQLAAERDLPWRVAEVDGAVRGFACANAWKAKSAYRFAVETSIYLAPDALGSGLGRPLYADMLEALRTGGVIRQAVACISLPNPASVRLHERLGFRPVGRFEKVGYKFERWIDVGYWQLSL